MLLLEKKNYSGQGLLEVIVAIGVITTGLVSALGLTVANLATTQTSAMRIVAANLAREGIEVVRNIRDNNWLTLTEEKWDQGLKCDDQTGTVEYEATEVNCAANSFDDAKLYQDGDGFFSHQISDTETAYQRLIILDDICAEGEGSCQKIGIRVRSQVQWQERGTTHSLTAEEWLYNWY